MSAYHEMEAAKIEFLLSCYTRTRPYNEPLEGRRRQLLLDRQRTMARFKHSQARRRSGHMVLTLAVALLATLVPRPRVQWMLKRFAQ